MPSMADDDGLTGEGISLERGEHQRNLGHFLNRGELLVHGLSQTKDCAFRGPRGPMFRISDKKRSYDRSGI
jgi:hypothetical protein